MESWRVLGWQPPCRHLDIGLRLKSLLIRTFGNIGMVGNPSKSGPVSSQVAVIENERNNNLKSHVPRNPCYQIIHYLPATLLE